jgi:phage recombination protein Bet
MSKRFETGHCALYLKEHLAPKYKPSDDWISQFETACNRTGLDPAQRQIRGQVHRNKVDLGNGNVDYIPTFSVLVTIDGLRVIAERSKKYEGQCGPFFCGEDGQWVDVWTKKTPPSAAKVGIFRQGAREPIWGIALFAEFKQGGHMWSGMPCHMIAKCAEAVGLRKAFPEAVSGLYIEDEMPQDSNSIPEGRMEDSLNAQSQDAPASPNQVNPESQHANSQSSTSVSNDAPVNEERPNERAHAFSKMIVESVDKQTLQASIERVKVKLANYPKLMKQTIQSLEKAVA